MHAVIEREYHSLTREFHDESLGSDQLTKVIDGRLAIKTPGP
jgi:hypothetical protein